MKHCPNPAAPPPRDELLLDASRLVDEDEAPLIRRRAIVPEAPAPQPEAPRSAGTLFERMANLSARRRDDSEDGGDDTGSSINIPRFLGRRGEMIATWPEPRLLRAMGQAGLACVLLMSGAPAVLAQGAPAEAGAGQGEGMDANRAMSAALARLGRDPRDVAALLQAGESALALGDTQAAIGFLSRADRL
ncbi:hypothetical protein E4T56_gene5980, partial [Termitomyces sp. T112]